MKVDEKVPRVGENPDDPRFSCEVQLYNLSLDDVEDIKERVVFSWFIVFRWNFFDGLFFVGK